MPSATDSNSTIEAAVRKWNALATASFPELKDSLDDARGALTQLLRAFEERRVLSQALILQTGEQPSLQSLDALADALATFHVELRTLGLQANRALDSGAALVKLLSDLSGNGFNAPVLQVTELPETLPEEGLTSALQARVRELEAEVLQLRQGPASMPAVSPPAPKAMQDELVRLRLEVEELREESVQAPMTPGPDVDKRIRGEAFDTAGKRRPMGLILLKAGLISTEQLELALSHQRSAWNRHLGSILVELGYVEDESVARAIAAQTRVDFIRLQDSPPNTDAVRMISRKLAEHHTVIPIRAQFNELVVAMANPLDLVALEDLKLASGRPIQPVVATTTDINAAIKRYFGK